MSVEGTGIDLVKVSRIRNLHKKWGDKFLKKVFTTGEIDYSFQKRRPYEHLAARFAAKEAFIKAFKKRVGWKKMEVAREPQKVPYFCNYPRRLKKSSYKIHLTISHTKTDAIASVIIEKSV